MVMRYRERETWVSGQRIHKPYYDSPAIQARKETWERTEDDVATGDCGPFWVRKYSKTGGIITGETSSWIWSNWPASATLASDFHSHATLPTLDYGVLGAELLSRTNPSRTSTELPVSLGEIRELPKLVRESGELVFKNANPILKRLTNKLAKINVLIRFGILPVIGDINTLLQFQSLADARAKELDKLRTGRRGLRRTIHLHSDSTTGTYNRAVESVGGLINRVVSKTSTRTIKGHVRWHANTSLPEGDADLRAYALRLALGWRIDPSTFWEALPWSWMADYFLNVGTYLEATRNQALASPDTKVLMKETHTEISFPGWSNVDSSGRVKTLTGFKGTYTEKERFPVSAGLGAQLNILDYGQLSILGSLHVLQSRRYK
nr:MAG: hypothetical protein 1 [Leviviridae sp.]